MSATRVASHALGLPDEIGTIEKGKSADLLAVDANPLENISVLTQRDRIRLVVKQGQILVDKDGRAGTPFDLRTPSFIATCIRPLD